MPSVDLPAAAAYIAPCCAFDLIGISTYLLLYRRVFELGQDPLGLRHRVLEPEVLVWLLGLLGVLDRPLLGFG